MLICGDISLPNKKSIDYSSIPRDLCKKRWFGNLEGSIIDKNGDELKNELKNSGVFNSYEAIFELKKHIDFSLFSLANNHILDKSSIHSTRSNLEKLGVAYVGAGYNSVDAARHVDVLDENEETYTILAFGWDCIGCKYAKKNQQGVNPIIKKHVIEEVRKIKQHSRKIICFFHWNYELELYPQPYERSLAKLLIDEGVYAVIGCHSHRVQGIEFYKGKPIVYGLGNFLFQQRVYFDGKLEFPDYSSDELVFELGGNGSFSVHKFKYDKSQNTLYFVKSILNINPNENFEGKAVFSGYSDEDYQIFFKRNRVKKKLLPIFRYNESQLEYMLKTKWVNIRNILLNVFVNFGIKSAKRFQCD